MLTTLNFQFPLFESFFVAVRLEVEVAPVVGTTESEVHVAQGGRTDMGDWQRSAGDMKSEPRLWEQCLLTLPQPTPDSSP